VASVERLLLLLATVAAVALVLSSALLTTKPHLLRGSCADARAFARDAAAAFLARGAVTGVYRFDYPVVVNASGIFCGECLVSLSAPTQNSTILAGRQRLVIDATSGVVVLRRL